MSKSGEHDECNYCFLTMRHEVKHLYGNEGWPGHSGIPRKSAFLRHTLNVENAGTLNRLKVVISSPIDWLSSFRSMGTGRLQEVCYALTNGRETTTGEL